MFLWQQVVHHSTGGWGVRLRNVEYVSHLCGQYSSEHITKLSFTNTFTKLDTARITKPLLVCVGKHVK